MLWSAEMTARLDIKSYFDVYDDVTRMNKTTNADVKCVATLQTKTDDYEHVEEGSKKWFLKNWTILNPEKDTDVAKKHRNGLLDSMKTLLGLSESQHFVVDVDYTDGISNSVVFYIDEILTKLAGKYEMTLAEALQTIHDTRLGREKMGFINEAFDDQMDLRNPPAKRRRIDMNLSHLQTLLEDLKNLRRLQAKGV
jgi:hypothetical protein